MNLTSPKKSTSTQALHEPLEGASTEQLVQASQAGQNSAFGELASRFEPMVYAICQRRLGNHTEAQEVTQEVLIKAYEKLDQLQQPAAFPGWLRSIAVRQSINRHTRRALAWRLNPRCSTHRITATRRRWTICWPMSAKTSCMPACKIWKNLIGTRSRPSTCKGNPYWR